MWGEQADASDLDRAIWPRAAAIGERLWTPLARLNVSAQERLGHFRCLLNARKAFLFLNLDSVFSLFNENGVA